MINMNFSLRLAGAVFVALALSGCGSSDGESGRSATNVLVRAGGSVYRQGDLERDLSSMREVLRLARYDAAATDLERNPGEFRRQAVSHFAKHEPLAAVARRQGLALSPDEREVLERQVERMFSSVRPVTYAQIRRALGAGAKAFWASLEREALADKVRAAWRAELRMQIESKRSVDLGRLATNAWRSVCAGNDFATVAAHLTERDPRIEYVEVEPPVGMPEGVRPPVADDEGLRFAKVWRGADGVGREGRLVFHLMPSGDVDGAVEAALARKIAHEGR